MPETTVLSFVLRFVQEHDPLEQTDSQANTAGWRGTIRHVQTNEELRFTHIQEALQFLAQYVEIDRLIWIPKEKNGTD